MADSTAVQVLIVPGGGLDPGSQSPASYASDAVWVETRGLAPSLLLCSTPGRMADFAGGAIQAFVGPTELAAADDLEAIIVGFIGEAQESLDISVREIDSEIIAQASRPDLETANPPAPMASCRPAPPRAA